MRVRKWFCKRVAKRRCCGLWLCLWHILKCSGVVAVEPEFVTLKMCLKSGWVAHDKCPSIERSFVEGTEPKGVCPLKHHMGKYKL